MLVGLDIETTKTTAVVGEVTNTGIDIIGIGTSPAKEIRKGAVVNIDNMVELLKQQWMRRNICLVTVSIQFMSV